MDIGGLWKRPGGQTTSGTAIFPELNVYGASIRGQVAGGIGNLELAYYESAEDPGGGDPLIDNSEMRYLVGYARDLAMDLNASFQYYVEQLLDYGAYENSLSGTLARDEFRHVITLQLTQLLMNQTLELSLAGYYSPSDEDAYLRPRISYDLTDSIILETGANIFIGERGLYLFRTVRKQFEYLCRHPVQLVDVISRPCSAWEHLNTESGESMHGKLTIEAEAMDRLKRNPRENFNEAIEAQDLERCLIKTAEIHGHYCPGSTLGVMASVYGLSRFGDAVTCSDGLENLMAVVEINACFADGVQAVSGCTLGNNALIYRDLGKHAVALAIRGDDTGVRVCARPDFRETIGRLVPAFYPLMEKVIKNRSHTQEEEQRFKDIARKAAFTIIKEDFEDIFSAERVRIDLPGYAPIVDSMICNKCGEQLMSTKAGPNGRCLTCAGKQYFQVEGRGGVPMKG